MATISTTTPKPLPVPFLPALDAVNQRESHAEILTIKGTHTPIALANWASAYPTAPVSEAWLAHGSSDLYVLFSCVPRELRGVVADDLGPVADDTCFEIFLKPAGGSHYCNFEFNYLGVANVSRRTGRTDSTKFTPGQLSRIRRLPLITEGNISHSPEAPLSSVKLIVIIPLDLIGLETPVQFPAMLEGNIYSCSAATAQPYYLSWVPIDTPAPDFHRPEFFRPIQLL